MHSSDNADKPKLVALRDGLSAHLAAITADESTQPGVLRAIEKALEMLDHAVTLDSAEQHDDVNHAPSEITDSVELGLRRATPFPGLEPLRAALAAEFPGNPKAKYRPKKLPPTEEII
jgi:hypothetical protein